MSEAAPVPRQPGPLHAGWRWVTAIIGLGLVVLGALAVFKTMNDIGATALLVVGAFFWLVTVLGRVPRVKFGENEIEPYAAVFAQGTAVGSTDVREAVEDAVEAFDSEAKATPAEKTEEDVPDTEVVREPKASLRIEAVLRAARAAEAENYLRAHPQMANAPARIRREYVDAIRRGMGAGLAPDEALAEHFRHIALQRKIQESTADRGSTPPQDAETR